MSTERPSRAQDNDYIIRELGVTADRIAWLSIDRFWHEAARRRLCALAAELRALAAQRQTDAPPA